MDRSLYRRRQSPLWFLLLILGLAGIGVVVWHATGLQPVLWSITGGAALLLLLFWGLRVEVTDTAVHLTFGIGIIRKTIPRSRVKGAQAVRNEWWWGWGIRLTPRGWMWNISGLDAVEVEYADGGRFRIGTDDPKGLLDALGPGLPGG